jgi:hypothetical protein
MTTRTPQKLNTLYSKALARMNGIGYAMTRYDSEAPQNVVLRGLQFLGPDDLASVKWPPADGSKLGIAITFVVEPVATAYVYLFDTAKRKKNAWPMPEGNPAQVDLGHGAHLSVANRLHAGVISLLEEHTFSGLQPFDPRGCPAYVYTGPSR